MFPWLAMGHIIPYFQLGQNLAQKNHEVTLLLPNKAKLKLPSSNHNPNLTLHTITIPHVDPLPLNTQLTSDIPFYLETHLATALDRLRPEFESILASLEPNLIFYDFAHWVPDSVSPRVKCVNYVSASAVVISYFNIPSCDSLMGKDVVVGYPLKSVSLKPTDILFLNMNYGEGITFHQRTVNALKGSHAIAIRTIREIEGKFCDFLSTQYDNKLILCAGALTAPDTHNKDVQIEPNSRWAGFLSRFGPGSVVFCSFGSQVVLDKAQFQELLLGFEMTNLPFLVVLKPPTGYATIEEAYPEGFIERVAERGMVTGEWVPQPEIVGHVSVGCFVNHCGSGSIWEALLSKNQIVLIPQHQDQVLLSKLLVEEMKVGVCVERGKDGKWVSKESLCKAINSVMDENDDVGKVVKENHEFLRDKIGKPKFMSDYFDNFVKDLEMLVS